MSQKMAIIAKSCTGRSLTLAHEWVAVQRTCIRKTLSLGIPALCTQVGCTATTMPSLLKVTAGHATLLAHPPSLYSHQTWLQQRPSSHSSRNRASPSIEQSQWHSIWPELSKTLEDWFLCSSGTDSFEKLTAEFSASSGVSKSSSRGPRNVIKHIYICIYAVKLSQGSQGPSLPILKVIWGAKFVVL